MARPATAGLTLPRLTAPTQYRSHLGQRKNAALALKLLDAGVIEAGPHRPDEGVTRLIERGLNHRFATALKGAQVAQQRPTSDWLTLLLRWREENEQRLCGGMVLETGDYLDMRPLVSRLERLHPDAGANLLAALPGAMWLLPVFTSTVTQDFLEAYYWYGDPGAGELYEMAAYDVAQTLGVSVNEVSEEATYIYAQEHFFTPEVAERRLPERYRQPNNLALDELEVLVADDDELLALVRAISAAQRNIQRLRQHPQACAVEDAFSADCEQPFALVLGLPPEDDDQGDLVLELYDEYEQSVWQSSEFGPSYCFCVDDTSSASQMAAFAELIDILCDQLACEARVLQLLKEGV